MVERVAFKVRDYDARHFRDLMGGTRVLDRLFPSAHVEVFYKDRSTVVVLSEEGETVVSMMGPTREIERMWSHLEDHFSLWEVDPTSEAFLGLQGEVIA